MSPNEYQDACKSTAIYPRDQVYVESTDELIGLGLVYAALELNGEAGEVAELVKKDIRDNQIDSGKLLKELGDVAWALAMCSYEAGFTLEEVMTANLEKLAQRKAAGTLRGSGSDR